MRKYLESYSAALSEAIFLLSHDGVFDARGFRMKILGKPNDERDAITKMYVDRKIKTNDKRDDNMLRRDNEGRYVPLLMQNEHCKFDNKTGMNVSNPIGNSYTVNEEHDVRKIFYATTQQSKTYREARFQTITFDKLSSKLLIPY